MLEAIKKGTIHVGDSLLPERQLAEELGISRNTLREGLVIMEFLGITTCRNNRRILMKSADQFGKILGQVRKNRLT